MRNPQNWPVEEEEPLRAGILHRDPDFNNHLHSPSNVDLEGIHCYVCGVLGFHEFIATCRDCKSIFVHVYCMKTVLLSVPNDWMCEDCSEIPKQGEILIASPERAYKPVDVPTERVEKHRNMDPVATSLRRCDVPVCIPEKPSAVHTAEQSRCKKRISDEQIQSMVPEYLKKQKACAKDSVHNRTPSVLKPSPDLESFKELFIPTRTATKPRYGSGQGDDPYKVNLKGNKNTRDQRLNGEDPYKVNLKGNKNTRYQRLNGDDPYKVNLNGNKNTRDQRLNASENTRDQRLTGEKWKVDRYLPNHPASIATWKGCFEISGLSPPVSPRVTVWGYPPAKVAKKAYEFSKEMPVFLPFEAIPRSTVWENMFNDDAPDKNDIGLYFFPNDDRSAQYYSCLVSHVEKQDIILKSCINGINLLIFSSSFLDEKSKEINQAYYLWGLFVDPVTTFKEPVQIQIPSETNTEAAFEHGAKNSEDIAKVGGGDVKEAGCEVQVKLEKWEVPPFPGFRFAAPDVGPSAPPGFEGCWKVKYKTISEILESTNRK